MVSLCVYSWAFNFSPGNKWLHTNYSRCKYKSAFSFQNIELILQFACWLWSKYSQTWQMITQGCKFSGNCLNSGFHEVKIPALIFIFSPFWRILAQIYMLFQAFQAIFFRSAYIPDNKNSQHFIALAQYICLWNICINKIRWSSVVLFLFMPITWMWEQHLWHDQGE